MKGQANRETSRDQQTSRNTGTRSRTGPPRRRNFTWTRLASENADLTMTGQTSAGAVHYCRVSAVTGEFCSGKNITSLPLSVGGLLQCYRSCLTDAGWRQERQEVDDRAVTRAELGLGRGRW